MKLIEASYLKKMLMLEQKYTMISSEDFKLVIEAIDDAPTVDAAPVVHGEWSEKHSMYVQDGAHKRKCSACNKYTNNIGEPLRYCPNCGAKMKGVQA